MVTCVRGLMVMCEGADGDVCKRAMVMCVRALLFVSCMPTGRFLRQCFENISKLLVNNESRLNDLDKASGDGDTGTTLRNGATGEHCL